MIDKRRSAGVLSSGQLVAGEVEGATVLLLDDQIASGETLQRSATALRRADAKEVIGCAAHGLFVDNAPNLPQRAPTRTLMRSQTAAPAC